MSGVGRFFWGVGLGLGLALVMQVAKVGVLWGWQSPGEAVNLAAWYAAKDELFAGREGRPKVVLVGGSSVFYGVGAKQLEGIWGVPVVNYGTHAGLGLDYLLARARRVLQPGDLVLVILEYGFFQPRKDLNEVESAYYLGGDPSYLRELGMRRLGQVLFTPTWGMVWARCEEWWRGEYEARLERKRLETGEILDGWGDRVGAEEGALTEAQRKARAELVPVAIGRREDYGLDRSVWEELDRFVRWAEGHGVTVVAGYACTLDGEELRGVKADLGRARIREGFAALGVEVVGSGQEALRAREDFFDTNYHLTREGRERWTAEFGRLAAPVIETWRAQW